MESANELAILYLDSSISQKPETHYKYLALAQAMAEAGYQFDVLYVGDGEHNGAGLDLERLKRYKALLVPEAGNLSKPQADTLTTYTHHLGGQVVVFSASPIDRGLARQEDGKVLFDFWNNYQEGNRQRILASVGPFLSARLRSSDPMVNIIRYARGDEHVLHLLNYNYDAIADCVLPSRHLRIRVPCEPAGEAACTLLGPDGEQRLECALEDGELTLEIPNLDLYGLVVVGWNYRQPDATETVAVESMR